MVWVSHIVTVALLSPVEGLLREGTWVRRCRPPREVPIGCQPPLPPNFLQRTVNRTTTFVKDVVLIPFSSYFPNPSSWISWSYPQRCPSAIHDAGASVVIIEDAKVLTLCTNDARGDSPVLLSCRSPRGA